MADYNYGNNEMARQKDLVLAPNEFCFVQNKTSGAIKTYAGPIMLTISQQEALVIFNTNSKSFVEVSNFEQAKQLYVNIPENWYVILKNPSVGNVYPEAGKANVSAELNVGKKINVRGPASFALYPGQMTKIVRGHALRTNQYLLARVYEAESASNSDGEMLDGEGKKIEIKANYVNGQILVIKGTEVSFYIPPTGIEVIPINNDPKQGYVREAITLERLEYAILKDENGSKTYAHGPQVVFPKPTETFVTSPKGGYVFRAIELSPISGIYAKVIAEYKEKDAKGKDVVHPVGEELFITGNDQMIYYPRPEHAIINYDDKIMHHAIAIPKGEGRYIMNRLTGEIKTVKGPAMYLPDPRTEVVVKRKLSARQCELWFPGNREALEYNEALTEKAVEKSLRKSMNTMDAFAFSTAYAEVTTMANLESKANISRGTSYTKPRTITLDNKYDGVVSMDIWSGYAVNIVSKDGNRQVVCGPQTILLDYDQTLEVLHMSTGKPKTTDNLLSTVFLRHENNKVTDIVEFETADHVRGKVKLSYSVSFLPEHQDRWFSIDNYVKYLCDHARTAIKRKTMEYTIEQLYADYVGVFSSCIAGMAFEENGMVVQDCEVMDFNVQNDIARLLEDHQYEMVQKALELTDANRRVELVTALADAEQKEQALKSQQLINKMELQRQEALRQQEIQSEVNRKKEAEKIAAKEAEKDMQAVLNLIADAENARKNAAHEAEMLRLKNENEAFQAHNRALAEIEKAKNESYAATVANIMASIQPELIAALESQANAKITEALGNAIAPYAIAGEGESVADVVQKMVHGTSFEDVIKNFSKSN